MGKNMLTTKESAYLTDLLTCEALASKKAKIYSKILTNKTLCDRLKKLSDNHTARFNALFELL